MGSLLLKTFNTFAQSNFPVSSCNTYSIDDGLTQVSVYDIEQDLNGYIWVATQRGINRFDGYKLIHGNQAKRTEPWLSGAMVTDIELDKSTGDMWFATSTGLGVLRADSGQFESFSKQVNKHGSQEVLSVHVDNFGNVWIGTKQKLFVLYKNTNTLIVIGEQSEALLVYDIEHTQDNILWVSTTTGLKRYDIQQRTWLPTLLEGITGSVILPLSNNEVWLGTASKGIFVLKRNLQNEFEVTSQLTKQVGLLSDIINDLKVDVNEKVWVGTTDGISFISAHSGAHERSNSSDANSLPYSITKLGTSKKQHCETSITNALSIYHDRDGFVFVGTLSKGFSVINANQALFEHIELDTAAIAYSISIEDDDNIWVPSEKGLYRVDRNNNFHGPFVHNNEANESEVSNILQDAFYSHKYEALILGSRLGLYHFNKDTLQVESLPFPKELVYSVSDNQNGDIFLGTRNTGLYLYHPVKKQIIKHWDIPLSFSILALNDEEILVPTTNGLYKINTQSDELEVFTHNENDPTSIAYNVVTWVSKRAKNEYLVGTQAKGLQLMSYSGKTSKPVFRQLFADTKLSSLSIGAVVEDTMGNYWITTTEGIVKVNSTLDQITFYDESDGVNPSGYFIDAHGVNSNGRIFFAGVDGITHFNPAQIMANESFPALRFTNIKTLDSDNLSLADTPLTTSVEQKNRKIVLEPNNLVLTIEFAALEFASPDKIQYAYKLEGFHSQWQYTDSRIRLATFSNLAPGEYTFKVNSTNRYQQWNDTPISLSLSVLAPWWETKLAIFLFFIMLLLIALLLFKWRCYSLNKYKLELERLVSEKTQDLERANEQLKQLSIRDPLTQTLNRRGFTEYAEREMSKFARTQQSFCLILLDIDHFKQINDTYGHELGDKILIEISKLIHGALRQGDIMARWGGEEFIILLPNTELTNAAIVADKVRQLLSKSNIQSVKQALQVTFSAGISEIAEGQSLDQCIKQADMMLYEAKQNGRNMVRMSPIKTRS